MNRTFLHQLLDAACNAQEAFICPFADSPATSHLRQARRHHLMAVRALLDDAIAGMDEAKEQPADKPDPSRSIPIKE